MYDIRTKHITVSAKRSSSLYNSLPSIASEKTIRPLSESFWDPSRGSPVLRVAFAAALSSPQANEVHVASLQPTVSDPSHLCFVLRQVVPFAKVGLHSPWIQVDPTRHPARSHPVEGRAVEISRSSRDDLRSLYPISRPSGECSPLRLSQRDS